ERLLDSWRLLQSLTPECRGIDHRTLIKAGIVQRRDPPGSPNQLSQAGLRGDQVALCRREIDLGGAQIDARSEGVGAGCGAGAQLGGRARRLLFAVCHARLSKGEELGGGERVEELVSGGEALGESGIEEPRARSRCIGFSRGGLSPPLKAGEQVECG